MSPPTSGRGPSEPPLDSRRGLEFTGSRRLLKRLTEVVAEPVTPQERLDRIVSLIAANIVAEVCSVYFNRAGDVLELFATQGLAKEAVHATRLRVGEGLVGNIAAQGSVINTADAQTHPNFAYRPETGEEVYHSFLGVPILRSGRVLGVLTVQNRARRTYAEDEVDAMQVIASLLAEMFAAGGLIDTTKYADLAGASIATKRLDGVPLVEGVAVGRVWLHERRVEVRRLLADDPAAELVQLERAIDDLRRSLDELIARTDLPAGEQREVLEAYRMFAHDTGWFRRMREAVETGLSAEAAVRRVQEEARVRIGHASDPYMRERLLDLDDLAHRLLRHLVGQVLPHAAEQLPTEVILVARNLSAADLIEYDRARLRGVILEEGSRTAHVTIIARAFGLPMLGRVDNIMSELDTGDLVALDGDHGQVYVRPGEEVLQSFQGAIKARTERRQAFELSRDLPSVTRDGISVALNINAAFLVDLAELGATGAEGCGLYRTELNFMSRPRYPDVQTQAEHYRHVLDQAAGRPVVFRTLDIGSDKHLPYWRLPIEENPAMGWRALRLMLDRPALLRGQLRALLQAAAGRELFLMHPMVADVAEFDAAQRLLDMELRRMRAANRHPPRRVEVGAMLEVPALFFQLDALLSRVQFISVGTNDLLQFLFACDRGNPALTERYDTLAPAVLAFLQALVERCRAAGVRLAVCGEMASRPLEAMALVGVGLHELSVLPSEVGPVKAMVRSLDAADIERYLSRLLSLADRSLRGRLLAYAQDHGVVLPNSVYQPA